MFTKCKNEEIAPNLPLSFYVDLYESGDITREELEIVVQELSGSIESLKRIIEILENE